MWEELQQLWERKEQILRVQPEIDGDCRSMNQASLNGLAGGPSTPFPYGSIHAEIPEASPAAVAICSVQEEIAEEDLAGRGLNTGPHHITLRYGVQGEAISAIEALLATQGTIAATLCATSCFPPSATRDVAVIIATIECPELHVLHQRLGEVIEFVEPTFACEPHVTVAYVRPEVAEKYVGNQITAGHRFVISEAVIRTKSKGETTVTLNG
jgi:2'-5' RNA ligase